MTYAPITPQNGEPFFIPKQRPGCERTTFRNTVESLTIPQQKVLGCLACQHHIQERKPALRIDRPKVRKCAKLAGSTTANIFNKLEETGHIIVTDEGSLGGDRRIAPSYAFTEEGRQLGAAVPAPESCLLRPIPRGIDKWVAIKVYDLYPIQPQKTFDGLQRLLRKGVLQQRSIDWLKASRTAEQAARFAQAHGLHDVETDRYLMFNPVVLPWFTAAQQAAIAFHFGVDRLLFGKDFSSIEISRALCLGGKNDLTTYVRGLLEPLPDALQRAKE
ncbi:MAG TPA: hypothetical protein VLF60_03355 [Candidatus Saccharimonadales bacterium]|nr:hypothetical protein [Candidatus Saccharimonadales bacterium]